MRSWRYGMVDDAVPDAVIVQTIYDAFARRDLDAALEHVAADAEFAIPVTARVMGRSTPYIGHEGVRQYFADADAVWDDFEIRADDIRATPGAVVVFGHVRGRIGAERIRRDIVWTWRLEDGLAVSLRVNDLSGPLDISPAP